MSTSQLEDTVTREKPILFSGSMVRAILDGRKTQTRRVVKIRGLNSAFLTAAIWVSRNTGWGFTHKIANAVTDHFVDCPYGVPGDRLWVRETFFDHGQINGTSIEFTKEERIEYRASQWTDEYGRPTEGHWTPSIHMPRWASRLSLEITEVRVERLQEISTHDIGAEGINLHNNSYKQPEGGARVEYRDLWDSLNAKRGYGWDANPWVWVISFRRLESPSVLNVVSPPADLKED